MQTATETRPAQRGAWRRREWNSGSAWQLNCEHELGAENALAERMRGKGSQKNREGIREIEIKRGKEVACTRTELVRKPIAVAFKAFR